MKDKKIKVLYIITQGEWGGAQKYVFDLATSVAAGADFDVTVAVGEPNGVRDLYDKLTISNTQLTNKVEIIQLHHLVRRVSPLHDFLAVFELARLYKKIKPCIVHLNSSKAGIIGSIARLLTLDPSTPLGTSFRLLSVIYTVHGWVFNEPLGKIVKQTYKFLEKVTAGLKDKIIVINNKDLELGRAISIPENKLMLIQNGISSADSLDRPDAREKLFAYFNQPQNPEVFLAGTIANFYPTKNLLGLLAATKEIKISDFRLVIIGDGQERKKIETFIAENNLIDRVALTGRMENAAEYLSAFDLFLLSSVKEGMPYTILEAAIRKIPIIATAVGGIPDLIANKKSGLLVEPDSPLEFASAITFAYNHMQEMREMAEKCQANVSNFSLQNTLQKTTSLYRSSC